MKSRKHTYVQHNISVEVVLVKFFFSRVFLYRFFFDLESNLNILFDLQLEASNRSCTVKVIHGGHLVRVGITFPSHYPNGAAPSFMFDKTTTINTASQQELTRVGINWDMIEWELIKLSARDGCPPPPGLIRVIALGVYTTLCSYLEYT